MDDSLHGRRIRSVAAFRLFFFSLFCSFLFVLESAEIRLPVRVLFLDAELLGPNEEPDRLSALSAMAAKCAPDVLLLANSANREYSERICTFLSFQKMEFCAGSVKSGSTLTLLSGLESFEIVENPDMRYSIRDRSGANRMRPMDSPLLHAVIHREGYRLHLIGTCLFGKAIEDSEFDPVEIRKAEARLLRQYVISLVEKEVDANVLVIGNLNEDCGQSAVKELYGRRFGVGKRLFDLRPLDSFRTSWTYWNAETDDYERFDHALCTVSLLPEIQWNGTRIPGDDRWVMLSRHRPLLVTVGFEEMPPWDAETILKRFPQGIRIPGAFNDETERQPPF